MAPATATRLVMAGVSASTLYTNNHVYIALFINVGQINEILIQTLLDLHRPLSCSEQRDF